MRLHQQLTSQELHSLIKAKGITLAGNRKLKIYGTLQCKSGKRMKKENRVFFLNYIEAKSAGYRPCGLCLRDLYNSWKVGITS